MKKIISKIINGMRIGIGFVIILFVTIYVVKARSGLTSSPGDKLTSAKRNELVSKFNGENRIDATLQNSWINYSASYSSAQYFKDGLGFVNIRGLVSGGSIGSSYCIFTLPAGYRPSKILIMPAVMYSEVGRPVYVGSNGCVYMRNSAGAVNNRFSLDGVKFKAEQ